MGCGASSRAPVEGAEHQAPVREATPHAILIEKAQKLSRDVDIMGPADPFVIIRLGPVGAAWSAKARETERVSDTCWNTVSPTWNFAFRFAAPPPGADWELHCRVFDKDDLSSDDFMGECICKMKPFFPRASSPRDPCKPFFTPRGCKLISPSIPQVRRFSTNETQTPIDVHAPCRKHGRPSGCGSPDVREIVVFSSGAIPK